jgi:hypothetical protein
MSLSSFIAKTFISRWALKEAAQESKLNPRQFVTKHNRPAHFFLFFKKKSFCSNSSKVSKFGFEVLSVVGAVKREDRQLGGREHRCMRAGRRRVLCSATVHCDETAAPAVSTTCCRASADRARLCWSHRVGETGRGRGGVG